jgi:hypothetical protein
MVTVTVRFDVFVTALTLHCEFNSDNLVVTKGGGGGGGGAPFFAT